MVRQLRQSAVMISRRRAPLDRTPNLDGTRFLFLGGLHRSGTSIVHRLLRDHPDTSGIADSGAPQDEGQHLQSVFPSAQKFGGPGRFAFAESAHLTETDARVSDDHRQRLLREWGAWYDLEKRVLLEKSPPNLIRARFLQALLPGSRFAFIVRHPIAVALATVKWSKTPISELLDHWLVANRIFFSDLPQIESSLVFRYEDFVQQPMDYLQSIYSLCGLRNNVPAEQVSDFNRRYFEKWQAEIAAPQDVLAQARPELREFAASLGYSFEEPYIRSLDESTRIRPLASPPQNVREPAARV